MSQSKSALGATSLHYVRIKNSHNGNPRYLVECPNDLSLIEAKSIFNCKIATGKQQITIFCADGSNDGFNKRINLNLIISTYENIETFLNKRIK